VQSSREIVVRSLKFKTPQRMPRDLWLLPWAEIHHADAVRKLKERFPSDFVNTDYFYPALPFVKGDPYQRGEYVDEWGCSFVNYQDGIIGEVKNPLIADIGDWQKVVPPYAQLPENPQPAYDQISRFYEQSDKFVLGNCCPRPWERYQFVRGSENALMDVMTPEQGAEKLLRLIHEFYLKELEFWVKADVDAVMFMDDWGSQNQLLIPPRIWRELFKPLYKEYCDLAHAHAKFIFMHSDGHITEIYQHLIEIGVDAVNSQLFVMDLQDLARCAKGNITFWGEIDRQHVLPSPDPQVGREAVRKVAKHLYQPSGGVIAQLELGAGANPETAMAVFEEWELVEREARQS